MKDKLTVVTEAFKALGDKKRLLIIKILASNMDETHCVTDVAGQLGISQPAVSQHIKILKNIGLLEENRKGYRVYYTIRYEVFLGLKRDIDDLFNKAFEKCPNSYFCENCAFNNSCGK